MPGEMTLRQTQDEDSLELLAVNEETIARLYSAYADRFPDMRDFWSSLSEEEQSHAMSIRELEEQAGSGKMFAYRHRFKSAAIRTSIEHTEGEIAAANRGHIEPTNALSLANAIEQSLIESKFFEIFEGDSADLKQLLRKLRDDTARHGHIVRERWSSAKPVMPQLA